VKHSFLILIVCISINVFSQEKPNLEREMQFALIEASRLKMMGNMEEAVRLYKTCVASYPKCAVAWYELGTIYSGSGLEAESEKCLHNAYLLDKTNYWYVIAYTDLLNRNSNFREAIKILNKALKNFPAEEILLKYRIAENHYDLGEYNKSVKIINEIEKKYGYSQLITARKIEILKVLGNHNKTTKAFNNILEKDPENLTFNIMYAEYLMERGLNHEAIEKYEFVLTKDEENIYAITNLSELYAKIGQKEEAYKFLLKTFQSEEIGVNKKIQTLSFLLSDENRVKNDGKYIHDIIEYLYLKEKDNYEFLIVVYDYYFKISELTEAFKVIRRITELRNDNYIIWAQALYNGIQIEEYIEVIELGKKALKIFPNKDDLRVFVAMAYFNLKDYQNSYNILRETTKNFTEPDIEIQRDILLAESAYKCGNILESFEKFEVLISLDPENMILKNNYSYYMALEGSNLERAKELSYETILQNPESSTFLDTYAWILYKLELFDKAEYYIRKAIEYAESDNQEILEHMVKILLKNDKKEEAEIIRTKLSNLKENCLNE